MSKPMTPQEMGRKGGGVKGPSKARTTEQARAAVNARWHKIPADLENYFASEKLDGIRAIWTGSEFMTRHGNILNAPDWFKAGMPECRLDGELWMGRGTFDALQSNLQTKGSEWTGIKFMIFDLAEMRKTTTERISDLQKMGIPAHCELVSHVTTESCQLDAMEKIIVDGGGEGVCLRHKYENYRPANFIKVKRLFPDLDRWQG